MPRMMPWLYDVYDFMTSSETNADSGQPLDRGLSLSDLSTAFAEMLSVGQDPYGEQLPASELGQATDESAPPAEADAGPHDDPCPVTPRSILEAMLFVGAADNQPLAGERVAGLMRGVRPAEIDELVRELNEHYRAGACPYQIVSEAGGYRLVLSDAYQRLRDKFYGRTRQTRLSPAAIEILSIIAYKGAQTADEVGRVRGRPCGALLSQLVRRQLLSVVRDPATPRTVRYQTTPRFLQLFRLGSLDDLPRSQDATPR